MVMLDRQEQLTWPWFFCHRESMRGTDNQERCMCRTHDNWFAYLKYFRVCFNGLILMWAALSNTAEAEMLSQRKTQGRKHLGINRCPGEGFGLWQEVGIRVQAKLFQLTYGLHFMVLRILKNWDENPNFLYLSPPRFLHQCIRLMIKHSIRALFFFQWS